MKQAGDIQRYRSWILLTRLEKQTFRDKWGENDFNLKKAQNTQSDSNQCQAEDS